MRSRLLLPIETVSVHLQLLAAPFINKSLQLGTSELLPNKNKQNSICILKFSPCAFPSFSLQSFFFFLNFPLSLFLSTPPSQFPPSSPSPLTLTPASSGPDHWQSPLCESVREGVCMSLHWEHFFKKNLQHSLGVWERKRRPLWCCDLTKQTAGLRAVPPPADSRDSRD